MKKLIQKMYEQNRISIEVMNELLDCYYNRTPRSEIFQKHKRRTNLYYYKHSNHYGVYNPSYIWWIIPKKSEVETKQLNKDNTIREVTLIVSYTNNNLRVEFNKIDSSLYKNKLINTTNRNSKETLGYNP